jgi:hypothetical protein
MNKPAIILLAAPAVDWKQIRKEAAKLAKMFLEADMEDDSIKQQKLLRAAEAFSTEIEKKYSGVDEKTMDEINHIIDEEADRLSRDFFSKMDDEEDDF